MTSVVRAVAFDFNGTLSDDEPIMCAIYERLFAEHGRPMTEARVLRARSPATRRRRSSGAGWASRATSWPALVAERIRRYRARSQTGAPSTPTLREAVRYAAARVPVAVVSGAYREEIEPVLEAAGIWRPVRHASSRPTTCRAASPHPESYELLVERLGDGIAPAEVVVFEDTEAGIAAAKARGRAVHCGSGDAARRAARGRPTSSST